MTRPVLFVHSAGPQGPHEGSNEMVAHLRAGLGRGYDVRFPLMPDPDAPRFEAWRDRLEGELAALPADSLIAAAPWAAAAVSSLPSPRATAPARPSSFFHPPRSRPPSHPEGAQYALPDDFAARLPAIRQLPLYQSPDDTEMAFDHVRRYA